MPVVLATSPVIEGVPRSVDFFNIIFFAVLVSTIVQGTTLEALGKRLGLLGEPGASAAAGDPGPARPAPAAS